jgi:hypothetical protein
LTNERLLSADLEAMAKKVVNLHTLDGQLSKLMSDLLASIKELHVARSEKAILTSRVTAKE